VVVFHVIRPQNINKMLGDIGTVRRW
jgi:hypothetical protein